jgi:hypothetical protein
LRSLEIWGEPQERGRRHGQALAGDIRRLRRALLGYLARITLYAGALPLYGLLHGLGRRFWRYIPTPLQAELAGVAVGAEVGLSGIVLLNVLDDLLNSGPHCSALAVAAPAAAPGAVLMGRKMDYPLFTEYLSGLQTLFLISPHGGQPLASLAWPGYVGVCTGINAAGVALAQLSAMSRECSRQGVPAALRFRGALEAGATVAAVAEGVLKAPGTVGVNLLLCDPRQALVLELSARHQAVRHPARGLLTVTNHYQSSAMEDLKGRFPPRPPYAALSAYQFTEAYSQSRNRRLQEMATGHRLGPTDLQKILADPKIANAGTAGCTVFAPGERRLWVSQGKTPPVSQGPFVEVKPWG